MHGFQLLHRQELAKQNPLLADGKAYFCDVLFQATAETLQTIAADHRHLGAIVGFIAILHTWGQNLMHHPHLHCVVPGGGLSLDSARWVACRPDFFLPVQALSRLFRRLFLERLQAAYNAGALRFFSSPAHLSDRSEFARYLSHPRTIDWVVYAKEPFGGPQQMLDHLGRYTHRVAISNNRLLDVDVCIKYSALSRLFDIKLGAVSFFCSKCWRRRNRNRGR
ncbi:hypothetical protein CBA19CS22_17730 [Caballeronia novacaledonica]|uniref:Uncharacterized protein n=1 Tax=Caballeronia novacaledonica TaxID=1544861 RepID=A0ACB5QTB7_9BURK|nr:hypothetical protein CBA19CS22_17730 [Caballeronia novacaledonica]